MDNEAGLEHLSRRTTSNIDALLVVVNENPISIDTARSINAIIEDLKNEIRHKYVITNMVRDERLEDIRTRVSGLEMEYLGDIPADQAIEDAIFNGNALLNMEKSKAVEYIFTIMDKIGGTNDNT
jgi:CO dehydrogenase maturation factor